MPDTTARRSFRSWFQRPDRREGYLLDKGVLYLLIGFAYTFAPIPRTSRASLETATGLIPLAVFGLLWFAAGLYCIGAAYIPAIPSGFAVCVFMPTIWSCLYLGCWLNGDPGRGWFTAVIFLALARAAYRVAGLTDPRVLLGGRR